MRQKVVLVDEFDRPIGIAEKQRAHQNGALHRAFSIFVFNTSGQLLLQKRARRKYDSGEPKPDPDEADPLWIVEQLGIPFSQARFDVR